jgi:DNA mismatch endonuclease Vsr
MEPLAALLEGAPSPRMASGREDITTRGPAQTDPNTAEGLSPRTKVPRSIFSDVPEPRRRLMAAIRGQDTGPEIPVRRMLHAIGYRYRVHWSDLAGRPDVVFPSRRKAVFVHGCFWAPAPGMQGGKGAAIPRNFERGPSGKCRLGLRHCPSIRIASH